MESKTRTCIACRKKANKYEYIRIVSIDQEPVIDNTGKMDGRGIYICRNKGCIDKLLKSKNLSKILKIDVTETKLKAALAEMGDFKIGEN